MTTAQSIITAALEAATGVVTSTQLLPPEKRPEKFIVVSRVGGGSNDWVLRNPRFLVECFAPTEFEAEQLGELVWEIWFKLRTTEILHAKPDNNLTRYDDPGVKHHRFQFTGEMTLKVSA